MVAAAISLTGCRQPAAQAAAAATSGSRVIQIQAKRFSYTPDRLVLKLGVPVVLEFTSADRKHGFKVPELGLRADVEPGQVTRVPFTPARAGTFLFSCDVFCGDGHEEMTGELVVEP